MVTITATAPTVYQLRSLSAFGFGYQTNPDGSFSFCEEFESEQKAKGALIKLAEDLFYNSDYIETHEELADAIEDIEQYGTLTIDAVTAIIS